jgi:hypothetical protein
VTDAADPWLDTLTSKRLLEELKGSPTYRTIGSSLRRVTYHYWFHIGEILAIRQILGHPGLPEFVGDIDAQAPYRPEAAS